MPETLLKFLSWFYPIRVETTSSDVNPYLEVTWYNGKKMLNTRGANYSYGNLLKAFRQCMEHEYKDSTPSRVLMLGFGAGSVPAYVSEKYPGVQQTGVELDPEVIRLFQTHFKPIPDLKLINDDAIHYLKNSEDQFDLILVDLYIDLKVPSVFSTGEFASLVLAHLNQNGTVIFNQVINDKEDRAQWNELQIRFADHFRKIRSYRGSFINNFLIGNK